MPSTTTLSPRRGASRWVLSALLVALLSPTAASAAIGAPGDEASSQWTLLSEDFYEVETWRSFDPDREPGIEYSVASGFIQGSGEGLGTAQGLWGTAIGDPSICYHLELVNAPTNPADPVFPDPTPIFLSIELPLAAIGAHTLDTTVEITVDDTNGDGVAYLRPATVGQALHRAHAFAGAESTFVDTPGSIEAPGTYQLTASGGGGALPGGQLTAGMHVRLSPEDRLVVRGRAVLDDGSGAPICEIPDSARCVDGAQDLCLQQERFAVDVRGYGHDGEYFYGQTVPGGSADTGLFWFFEPDNWELLTKVLDGCTINGHYWVLQAAVTDVQFETEVYDVATGRSKKYTNRAGRAAPAVIDTTAFSCDAPAARAPRRAPPTATLDAGGSVPRPRERVAARRATSDEAAACTAGEQTLCLASDRYEVEVDWRSADATGSAQVAPLGSADSGLFYFFDPANWEMLVKVLDACAVNGHRWVFAAATTDVEYTLRVTDTVSGEAREYFNPLGTNAAAITDTAAFACP